MTDWYSPLVPIAFVVGLLLSMLIYSAVHRTTEIILRVRKPTDIWYKIQQQYGVPPSWGDCLLRGRQCRIESLPEAMEVLSTNQEYKDSNKLRIVKVTEEVIYDSGEKVR